MNFYDKLKKFTESENFDKAEPVKDFMDINKNPEKRAEPEERFEFEDTQDFDKFLTLVNPVTGEIKKGSLFPYINEFRRRNKDILLAKVDDKACSTPFFGVDRGEMAAYLSTIVDNEEAMKDLKQRVASVYTTEQTEIGIDDYVDLVIKGKISIITNPGMKMDVDGPSKNIPTNTPKEEKK